MVRLVVKRGEEIQFLYETSATKPVLEALLEIISVYNGRLKVRRVCAEMNELRQYGISLPPNMVGLTPDQLTELGLRDELEDSCVPSGGFQLNPDPIGRRNGRAPLQKMQDVLSKTMEESKAIVCKSQAESGVVLTDRMVHEALAILRGATMIVYPMNLPQYDPVRMELENREELEGTQDCRDVVESDLAQLWFSGKELRRGKTLADYVGTNEKTKLVVKLQKKGQGAPGREPLMTEEEQKKLMLAEYRRREELKRLDSDRDDSHMNSSWADNGSLKRAFHGLDNLSWRPK